ncbi:MAG: hypothetical protein SOH60_11250 [Lachnospiraceae bacterium]|jgi:serine/threonine protein kinase
MDDTRCALQNGFLLQLQSRNNGTLSLHIGRELGRGGSCIVYEAYYLASNGDRKWVRLKECCPAGLGILRAGDGSLTVPEENLARFEEAKERMKEDFHTLTSLYYDGSSYDSFVSSQDFYSAGNTIYTLFAYGSDSTLADRAPDTLKGCIEIVIKTAKAIRILHNAGYLYLDCKPENILYIQGQTERVQLFDLNSLIRIDSIKDPKAARPDRISFTPEYAAPELSLGKLSRLGNWTDVYALGALLFFLLFSSTPSISDCLRDAEYPFDQMRFQNPGKADNSTAKTGNRPSPVWNETLLRKLTAFFHHTLASYCGNRLPDMNAVITSLEELVPLADQKAPFLRSSHVDAPQVLLGREDERTQLDEWLSDKDHSILWITGAGGMGKTALVQDLCARHRRDIGLLLFLTLRDCLLTSIADDWQVNIAHTSRSTSETLREYALRKLSLLQTFAEEDGGTCLLVVDIALSADVLTEEDLALLRELHWKVILISHARPISYTGETLDLKPLTGDAAESMFLSFLNPKSDLTEDQETAVRTIALYAGGNSFLLRLLANQIHEGKLKMSAAASLLRGDGTGVSAYQGESLTAALKSIWNAENLTEDEILLLHLTELFSSTGINLSFLQEITRRSFDGEVSSLLHDGWISLQDGRLYLSSLVLPILDEIPPKDPEIEVTDGILRSLETCLSRQDTRLILPQEFFPVLRYRSGKNDNKEKTPAEIAGISDAEVLSCSLQALKTLQNSAISEGQAYLDLLFHGVLLLPTGEEETARDLSLLFLNRKAAGGAGPEKGLKTICDMPGVIADLFVIDYGAYACFGINDREDAALMVKRAEQVLKEEFSIPGDKNGTWTSYAKALSCYVLGSTDDELLDGDYAPISPDHGKIRHHMLSLDETGIKEAERSKDLDGGRLLAVMLCMEVSDILRFYQFPEDRHGLSRIKSGLSLPADRIKVQSCMNRAEEYVGFGKAGEKDLVLWVYLNRAWYYTVMDRDFQKAYDYLRRCFDLTDFGQKGADHVSIEDIDSYIVPVSDILRTFNRYKDSINVLEQGIDLCKWKAGIAPFDRKKTELEDCISDCRAEQEYFGDSGA